MGNGLKLSSCKFYLGTYYLTPMVGNIVVKLYDHMGTFGSTGKPGGTLLATSNPVDISTLPGYPNHALVTFTFDGTFTLEDNTPYVLCLSYFYYSLFIVFVKF